jgi:hypothetical protein
MAIMNMEPAAVAAAATKFFYYLDRYQASHVSLQDILQSSKRMSQISTFLVIVSG